MINRDFQVLSATILNNAAVSGAIDMRHLAGGLILTPSAWTAANIGFKVCDTPGGTFNILRDRNGAPVEISTIKVDGARWYEIPSEVYGAGYVQLWSKSATIGTETDTNQGADRALTVTLKG